MNDGVPLHQQQWSFRHSPNLDPILGERVEVVRGPSSVMWGPDALGGVVNIVQGPLPSAANGETVVHGDVGLSYFDNNDQLQGDVVLEGASGGFGWRAGLVHRDAGDLETPDGPLPNTDYEQTNSVVAVGYSGGWGTARVRWNHWEDDVGFYFPDGHPNVGFRLDLEDDTYAADLVLPTGAGDVTVLLSRQENVRKAFPPAAPVFPDPAVDLELVTSTARAGFVHSRFGAWKGRVAVEYRGVENDLIGPVPLVPNYEDTGYSLMAFEEGRFLRAQEGDFDRLILSLGLRWDQSNLKVPVGEANVPDGFDEDYGSVTGSLGLVYRATEQFSIAANVGRGWRPPNAFELFAFGDHVGVGAFQLGNADLQEEDAISAELSARYQSRHWRAVVTGFRSDYNDFIYLVELTDNEIDQELGAGWTQRPVFFYRQTDAVIDGLEASVSVVPLEQMELGLVYSSVNTKNDSTGTDLPQTPPDRVSVYVRGMTQRLGGLMSPFVELESVWVDDGVPSGPDEVLSGRPFGAATDSYTLLHLKAGVQIPIGRTTMGVNLAIRNLLDEAYTDFLYPYKGLPYKGSPVLNAGRDVRLLARFRF
jgi:outer membrane receptor protein involved in Fe transport